MEDVQTRNGSLNKVVLLFDAKVYVCLTEGINFNASLTSEKK